MRYQKRRKPTAKAVSIDTNTFVSTGILTGASIALLLAMIFEIVKLAH